MPIFKMEKCTQYKVGDKVRIRKDLVVDKRYGSNTYVEAMDDIAKANNYVLTIYKEYNGGYIMLGDDYCRWTWTDEMIEGLYVVEPTDREKFKGWMRKLSSLEGWTDGYVAFNNLTLLEPDDDEYEGNLEVVANYLFDRKKKMTKAEIEAELGYEIEIVEG